MVGFDATITLGFQGNWSFVSSWKYKHTLRTKEFAARQPANVFWSIRPFNLHKTFVPSLATLVDASAQYFHRKVKCRRFTEGKGVCFGVKEQLGTVFWHYSGLLTTCRLVTAIISRALYQHRSCATHTFGQGQSGVLLSTTTTKKQRRKAVRHCGCDPPLSMKSVTSEAQLPSSLALCFTLFGIAQQQRQQ